MRKFFIFCSFWLGLVVSVFAADNFTLTDGSTLSGDIVKFDDYDVMIHTTGDGYTNINWPRFSQDTLKQLSTNPKYKAFSDPFIKPPAAPPAGGGDIKVSPVSRMILPEHPSIIGGMLHSSLGLFILLIIYAANLYAAYEVAVVRGKPIPTVIAVSVVLPIIGPIIFLSQKVQTASAEEAPLEEAGSGAAAGAPAGSTAAASSSMPGAAAAASASAHDDVQIVPGVQEEQKKPEPQVFSRGKFTLNKRFIETKFAGFIGEPKGDARNFSMQIKTSKETIAVECIKQTGPAEAILETPNGQLTLAYGDIQEIKLIPKPA